MFIKCEVMIIPKIVENLRENRIAAGTVYNDFPSKEALSAAIMMVDW